MHSQPRTARLLSVGHFCASQTMAKRLSSALIFFAMTLTLSLPDASAQQKRGPGQPVDLVVLGGTIVTMDEGRRVIEDGGIAVARGRIAAVGTRSEIGNRYAPRQT